MVARGKLTQERIVEATLQMLDSGGDAGFSMRKLAGVLEVDPMAIYHHHANKSALMNAVMDAMIAKCEVPEPSGDWQRDVRILCLNLRRLALEHPGAFRIYETHEDWLPSEHRLHEALHAALRAAGLSKGATVKAGRMLLTYTESFAVDEITGWLDPADVPDLAESLTQGPYPVLTSLLDALGASDADAEFAFGLDVMITGLQAKIDVA